MCATNHWLPILKCCMTRAYSLVRAASSIGLLRIQARVSTPARFAQAATCLPLLPLRTPSLLPGLPTSLTMVAFQPRQLKVGFPPASSALRAPDQTEPIGFPMTAPV